MVSGVTVPAAAVAQEALARIPNFAGVKFTGEDLGDLGRVIEVCGDRCRVFFGRDDMLLPAMALGVRNAVGMTFNFTAPIARAMVHAFGGRDIAKAACHQKVIRDILGAAMPFGIVNALKALGQQVAIDCGPCRLPLTTLTHGEARSLADAVDLRGALAAVRNAALKAA